MTAPVFVRFLEEKFAEHGIKKMVPDGKVLEAHARRIIEQHLAEKLIEKALPRLKKDAEALKLPADLDRQIRTLLAKNPVLAWDMAVVEILKDHTSDETIN
jgi:hypothetical protein